MSDHVDAIIVHFGPFDLLDRCIRYLQSQVDTIVVVNNDNQPLPESLTSRYHDVQWDEPGTNLGFGRGVNRGLAYTTGAAYVLVVNPDVTVDRGLVSELASYLDRNQEIGVVGPRLLHPDGSLQASGYRLPTIIQLSGYLLDLNNRVHPLVKSLLSKTPLKQHFGQLDPHEHEKTVQMITGACMMIRRKAVVDAGPFDPGFFLYYEEKDLCKRFADAGWNVGFTPAASAFHQIGGSGSPSSPDAIRHRAMGALRYFRRHGSPAQNVIASILFATHAVIHMIHGKSRRVYRDILTTSLSGAFPCDSCS